MRLRPRLANGDTIIEVLLCIAILAQVFVVAYAVTSHSYAESITAAEHTKAMKLAQSQLESLKIRQQQSSNTFWTTNFMQSGQNFCLDTTATDPNNTSTWGPIIQNETNDPTQLKISPPGDKKNYNAQCVTDQSGNGINYFINVSASGLNVTQTYFVTVRWNGVDNDNQNMVQFFYRLAASNNNEGLSGTNGCLGPPNTCNGQWYGPSATVFIQNSATLTPQQLSGIQSCKWDWDDGTQTNNIACSPSGQASHDYGSTTCPTIGQTCTYIIKLTITMSDGTTVSTSKPVTITNQYNQCGTNYMATCYWWSESPSLMAPDPFLGCNPNTDQTSGCTKYSYRP